MKLLKSSILFHCIAAIAIITLPITLVCCGPGKAATGTVGIELSVTQPDPLQVEGATIKFTKALLHLEGVEVLGGSNVTQHSHDNNEVAAGSLKVVSSPTLVDLLKSKTQLTQSTGATAGEYTKVAVSLSNAEEGDSKGYVLWLEGTAEKGTDTRTFQVKWSTDKTLEDFAEFTGDFDLKAGGSVTINIDVKMAELLSGIDLFAAKATGAQVTIDKDNNADLLTKLEGNLKNVFSLK